MKFALTFFLSAMAAVASAKEIRMGDTLTATSQMGKHLLSKARRLDENGEDMMNWLGDYSLKFQGCHHLVQWNAEADGEEDVRLVNKRLVRFRLCPTNTCTEADAGGCSENYGDYIIDMETYLNAYYESKQEYYEGVCDQYAENNCNCQDNGDDGYSEDKCQYECIVSAGMESCYQYMEDKMNAEIFEVEKYMECGQFEYNNNNGRKLNNNNGVEYFVGPFCAAQGGSINLGMFSDDQCTIPVEDDTYGAATFKTMTGISMPYAERSLVGADCLSCVQANYDQDDNNNNNNGEEEEVELTEACQMTYQMAGKCETNLPSGTVYSKNENACTYMSGIKVVREDGMVFYSEQHADAVTTAFIVIFAIATVSMAVYVWYLRTRLNIKTDTLL